MDSSPFLPGTKTFIHVPIFPEVRIPPASADPHSFVIDIPARIGLSVKNMSTFGPGKAGGGGIGFSANLYNSTFCCVLPSASCEVIVKAKRSLVIKHHIEVFRECLRSIGWSPLFSVLIVHEDRFPAHCGLGSTSGAALGTLHGLNMCLSEPFTREEIRRILACNYVEESQEEGKSDFICFGYETTMTATGANGGGFFVIDEENLNVLARNCSAFQTSTGSLPVYLFSPDTSANPIDEPEVLTEGASTDSQEDEITKKERIFRQILIPQLNLDGECDLSLLGNAISDLQNSGGKRVEVERQPTGQRIYAFMDAARKEPDALIVGMSSIGPTTAVVCKLPVDEGSLSQQKSAFERLGIDHGLKLDFLTSVNVTGLRAREVRLPVFVPVIGKPFSGKTYLCEAVSGSDIDFHHFAMGGFLRKFVKEDGGPVAQVIREIMQKGEVEDRGNLTLVVLLEELFRRIAVPLLQGEDSTQSWWLLDGFPRSGKQLETVIDFFGLPVSAAVIVSVSESIRETRITLRADRHVGEPAAMVRDEHDQTQEMMEMMASRRIRILECDSSQPFLPIDIKNQVKILTNSG